MVGAEKDAALSAKALGLGERGWESREGTARGHTDSQARAVREGQGPPAVDE